MPYRPVRMVVPEIGERAETDEAPRVRYASRIEKMSKVELMRGGKGIFSASSQLDGSAVVVAGL